jgi:hypothetical protein
MAEKARKRSAVAAKQEMQSVLAEVQKSTQEQRAAESTPAERIEERATRSAVESADALSLGDVVKDITQLRSSVGRTLSQIADSLQAEVDKYQQVKKAIEVKEKDLAEIYEIERQAVSLAALLEAQQRKREEFEAQVAREKEEFEHEMARTRELWDSERQARETELKEQAAADAKVRQRERDEYQYKFAREQQQARDQFADEKARIERELALRREELERQMAQREAAVASREQQFAELQEQVQKLPAQLEAAAARAAKEAAARAQADAAAREELLKREAAGEKNVLTTRIASLEQTVKDQAEQIKQLSQKLEKAYGQVQEIAVRAIEGSSNSRTLVGVQQLLAEQSRKPEGKGN